MNKIKLITSVLIFLIIASMLIIPKAIPTNSSIAKRKLPIYCVKTENKQVALSFDAAWGNEDFAEIIRILKENNIKTTFFMTGGWVEKYPEEVKMLAAEGHDLGNHGMNHKQMSELNHEECISEIQQVHDLVKKLTDIEMNLFRPPYGDYNDNLIDTATELKYYPVQWDVDSLDWKDYGADSIIDTVCNNKNLGNGSIILMHNGAKYTKDALDTIIKNLKKEGYEIVPISKLIIKNNYYIDTSGRQQPFEPVETEMPITISPTP